MIEPVKGRSEAGRRREQRARQTRDRIVDAALRLFLARGYIATTVAAVAREAGVAPATVYQAFGTKQAILARALDVTIAGDAGPVALLERAWVRSAGDDLDPSRRLAAIVEHIAEVAARTTALKEVMRDAAATEPAVRDLIREDTRRRYRTHQALVDKVFDGHSASSVARRDGAVATFFVLLSSQTYQLLVEDVGWSPEQWRDWVLGILQRELLGGSQPVA